MKKLPKNTTLEEENEQTPERSLNSFLDVIEIEDVYTRAQTGVRERKEYHSLITQIITDMTAIPFNRNKHKLDPLEATPNTMFEIIQRLASIISTPYGKPDHVVFNEINTTAQNYPIDDVRTSFMLRQVNLLQ